MHLGSKDVYFDSSPYLGFMECHCSTLAKVGNFGVICWVALDVLKLWIHSDDESLWDIKLNSRVAFR